MFGGLNKKFLIIMVLSDTEDWLSGVLTGVAGGRIVGCTGVAGVAAGCGCCDWVQPATRATAIRIMRETNEMVLILEPSLMAIHIHCGAGNR
jgi:hypothetical protein